VIIVKIKAGLGNQMFQYALGRRLSLDWHDELKFDLSWFNNVQEGETPRDLEIDKFNVFLTKATKEEISRSQRGFVARTISKTYDRIRGRLDRNYFYFFHPSILRKQKFCYLDGYFQSYKYFDSIRETLLGDFGVKKYSSAALDLKKEIEKEGQTISLHIRRGDYVTTCKDWNGLCDIHYYERALVEIKKIYPTVRLYIFSDDIAWARESLKFDSPMIFVSRPELNSVEELSLMSLCKHQIIANSSFSWWAAWLNQNNKKIVIAPSRWLLAANIDTRDVLPESWIRI
jgi:hypothetical protein